MEPTRRRSSRTDGLLLVGAMAALMWLAEAIDAVIGGRLDSFGIVPRSDEGLGGILVAPFLHVGFGHLVSNTVPFLAMGAAIALGGLGRVFAVTAVVALVSGLGTWLVGGAGSVHLGASGVVFGYAAYLVTRGFFNRDLAHLAIGLVVGAVWGTALLGGLLPEPGISWQAHLFGAIGGVLAARLLRAPRAGRARPAGLATAG